MAKLYLGNQEIIPVISQSKYGADINAILGDVDSLGFLRKPTGDFKLVFNGVKDIEASVLNYAFYGANSVTSVSFPDLEALTDVASMNSAFLGNNITNVSFPKLTTISGQNAMTGAFSNNIITSISMPELTTISGSNAMNNTFRNNYTLRNVTFPKLESLTAVNAMAVCFTQCNNIENIYFPALKTTSFGNTTNTQFTNLLGTTGTTVTHTIHFPSNLESTIQGLQGYPLFGGTNGYIVLAFDLPTTS